MRFDPFGPSIKAVAENSASAISRPSNMARSLLALRVDIDGPKFGVVDFQLRKDLFNFAQYMVVAPPGEFSDFAVSIVRW